MMSAEEQSIKPSASPITKSLQKLFPKTALENSDFNITHRKKVHAANHVMSRHSEERVTLSLIDIMSGESQ